MITDKELELLKRKVKRERGINLDYYKENFVKRRVSHRIMDRKIPAIKYIHSLDEQEYQRLFKALSINVSEFFRDEQVWELFQDLILPNLIFYKEETGRKIIRAWSAGCASGEEAYTLAIILKEFLGDDIDDYLISITGTDIDNIALERARFGIYQKERVKNVKKSLLDKYFVTDGTWYEVNDEVKEMVRFRRHDLIHDEPFSHFDVIFCRNVAIYFSKELQEILFENFHHSLHRFGFLVLGKTEAVTGKYRKNFAVVDIVERIYRKL